MKSCQVTEFLGSGYGGSVFVANYENQVTALKLEWVCKNEPSQRSTRREWDHLQKIGDIDGIPTPISLVQEVGKYHELGLDKCGLELKETLPPDPYLDINYVYFENGFTMQLLRGKVIKMIDILSDYNQEALEENRGKFTEKDFTKLEETVREVHKRGLGLPIDASIIFTHQGPHIIDWGSTPNLRALDAQRIKNEDLGRVEKFAELLLS